MWQGQTKLSYLDFEYLPDNPTKTISVSPIDTVGFGNVQTNESKIMNITIQNTGNMTIHLDSNSIIPQPGDTVSEFSLTFPITTELKAGSSANARIRFAPNELGENKAAFKIYSDAQTPVITIPLQGNGTKPVSVSYAESTLKVGNLSPNPCTDKTSLDISAPIGGNIDIVIYNELGERVNGFHGHLNEGNNMVDINTGSLSVGMYYLKFSIGNETFTRKFIKQK